MREKWLIAELPRVAKSHARRLRLWSCAVLLCLVLFGLKAAFPDHWFLPSLTGNLSPLALLCIFMAALFCEFIDSSLGMGYGTTLTPLLLLAGFEPLQIVPCVLMSEFVTGLTASLMHHRDGNVDFLRDRTARNTAIALSTLSAAGAIGAVLFARNLPVFWLKTIIAIVIISVGIAILVTLRRPLRYRTRHIIALGTIAAFNKGISGGGYGPLVTAGQVVSGLSPKQAVAITSLTEGLTCFVGLTAYVTVHGRIDWALAMPLTLGALLSVPIATLTVRRLPEQVMRRSVGTVTCLLGTLALVKLLWP